jgi:hypothetical protein
MKTGSHKLAGRTSLAFYCYKQAMEYPHGLMIGLAYKCVTYFISRLSLLSRSGIISWTPKTTIVS